MINIILKKSNENDNNSYFKFDFKLNTDNIFMRIILIINYLITI